MSHLGASATHWSIVLCAADADPGKAADALQRLCEIYWYPIYAYARRTGEAHEDAQDFTQAFFLHLLSKDCLSAVDRTKGRFRSFLLACLKNFMTSEHRHRRTEKRGGGSTAVSWDALAAQEWFAQEPTGGAAPEERFDRDWALSLLREARTRLEEEYQGLDRRRRFERLSACLPGSLELADYATIGRELGITEAAVKMQVKRMRERYLELVKGILAQTVESQAEVDDELKYLFTVLANPEVPTSASGRGDGSREAGG